VKVSDFEYELPQEAIAQSAVEPRHDSRLLDTRGMTDHRFLDLPSLLDDGDLVILNETRVRAARLTVTRHLTGGVVELLILERTGERTYEALAKPARRLRPGVVLEVGGTRAEVVDTLGEGVVVVVFDADRPEALFEDAGSVPLPPYFTGSLPNAERYQTVYARTTGSAAAPTAGLHFTTQVLDGLRERGVKVGRIDLHVSLDTFRPMTVEQVEDHVMHSEWCSVPEGTARAVRDVRRRGGNVVAIGTTAVRALESHADGEGGVRPGEGPTKLFLRPGSPLTVVDLLVTNFHLPGSTLLVLLEAFMGPGWREVYQTALMRGYRFLSFGDAMVARRTGL
jgi:S-adenosylmethionine:tRNA ribosyltransferase-isomerase